MLPLLCYLLLASFSPARTQDLTFDFSKILEADNFVNGSIPISIDIENLFSPDDILNEAISVSTTITNIISTLEALKATIKENSVNDTTKINEIKRLIAGFNFESRISTLNESLISLKTIITGTAASLNESKNIADCMSSTQCVTTTSPGPTTALAPTMCWPSNGSDLSVNGAYSLSNRNYPNPDPLYNCQYIVKTGFAYHLNIDVNLQITRSASLRLANYNTGKIIAVFNSSTSNTTAPLKTDASAISVVSTVADRDSKGQYSFIKFNITFRTADICEDVNCGNGTCAANPDNTYSCNCNKCWATDSNTGKQCAAYTNKCVGSAKQKCTRNGGECVIDPTAALCATKCRCPGHNELMSKC